MSKFEDFTRKLANLTTPYDGNTQEEAEEEIAEMGGDETLDEAQVLWEFIIQARELLK